MRKPFIAGNWKMYTTLEEAKALALELHELVKDVDDVEIGVMPPFPFLGTITGALNGSPIGVGGQDIYTAAKDDGDPVNTGACTGKVSGPMLASVGCCYTLVGHSEQRQFFGDTDELVGRKVKAAFAAGLIPLLCVGESLDERKAGQTMAVVERQVREGMRLVTAEQAPTLVIAYEPVWAIGTGETATKEQAQDVHAAIRKLLVELCGQTTADAIRIQYGGSVKPSNAAELMSQPDVDGALVCGASLKAASFSAIVRYRETH